MASIKKEDLDRILETESCPDDIQLLVLGLIDGTLSLEEEQKALAHLTDCPSCFYMVNLYKEILDDEADDQKEMALADAKKKSWIEIPLKIVNSILSVIDGEYVSRMQPVHVLSHGRRDSIQLQIPFTPDITRQVTISKMNDHLNLEIATDKSDASYYIIIDNDIQVASPHNGIAVFERLPRKDMLLSEDMRRFIKISIDNVDSGLSDADYKG